MLKVVCLPWLTVLYFAVNLSVIQASDDREHVHIKVHMPEVVHKHNHYHKVKKHQHHQPLLNHHQPIDVGLSFAHENLGPQFFPTPLAELPEPELVGGDDGYDDNANLNQYAANVVAAMFEGDSLKFAQPYRPAVPPPPPPPPLATYASTHAPYLRQQLMQQLLAPEIKSVLTGGGAVGGGGGGGVAEDTNSLLADDFLNELKREYAKKLHKRKIYSEKLPTSQEKFRKRKKYARDSYQQQQQQHKQFENNFQSNNIYDAGPKLHSYQQQQELQQDFDDDLSDMMEEFDDKSSAEENFGGESFQDMYAAFTQSSVLQHPSTTTPTGLNWQPYQQQADDFMFPSLRPATTPYSFPLNNNSPVKVRAAAVTSTQPTTSNFYNPQPPYKKRKRRIKPKRNHIVVP